MTTGLDGAIAKVGGQKNATILVGVAGAGLVWFIGRRKKAASSQTAPITAINDGYADTAQDPTALYTGYDQLQQEIDNLRNQPGAPNPNPVPVPTSPGSPPPVAPIPPAPATPDPQAVAVATHNNLGIPVPTYRPPPGAQGSFNQPFGHYTGGPAHWGG